MSANAGRFLESRISVAGANTMPNTLPADDDSKRDEIGPAAAGQVSDIQELPDVPDADAESVLELVEEGNAFEAAAVEGVEDAPPPDVSEVRTREVPEDDVPEEYLDHESDVG
jgi:hypothetical protein